MYSLSHFKANNQQEVIEFMHAYPFITLCGSDTYNNPVATHIPVLFKEKDDKLFLQAHIMRNQKHTLAFETNKNVLAIFSGPHTYVSASWYSKQNTAGTWNYQSVHAKGILEFKDSVFLHELLTNLTKKFEDDPQSPALVSKMGEEYVTGLMKAIVGFEIEITSIEHVFKLSQNRDEKSYENIIGHLKDGDADAKQVAEIMQQNQSNVFNK